MNETTKDLKFRSSLAVISPLDDENIEKSDIRLAMAHCELSSVHGQEKMKEKIEADLSLIEERLESRLFTVIRELKFLCTIMSEVPLAEEGISEGNRRTKLLISVQKLQSLIVEINSRYEFFRDSYKNIHPILRMGGYRSLLVCLLESLQVISKKVTTFHSHSFQISRTQKVRKALKFKRFTIRGTPSRDDNDLFNSRDSEESSEETHNTMTQSLQIPIMRGDPMKILQEQPKKPKSNILTPLSIRRKKNNHQRSRSSTSAEVSIMSDNVATPPRSKEHPEKVTNQTKLQETPNRTPKLTLDPPKAAIVVSSKDDATDEPKQSLDTLPIPDSLDIFQQRGGSPRTKRKRKSTKSTHKRARSTQMKSSAVIECDKNDLPNEKQVKNTTSTACKEEEPDRAKILINNFYARKREEIEEKYTSEIETLMLTVERLKSEMNEHIERVGVAEQNALERIDNMETSYFAASDLPTKFCKKSMLILSDLRSKLFVCSSIKPGELFGCLDEIYAENPSEDPGAILAEGHLGYETNSHMIEYSKKMKVIYCAVNNSFHEKNILNTYAPMVKQMKFTASAAYHMVLNKQTADTYGGLRQNLDVDFVRDVWDLLEDPVTSFFATSLGFAPSIERMRTNTELRIPVTKSLVFPDTLVAGDPKSVLLKYRVRCLYISPYSHRIDDSLYMHDVIGRANFDDSVAQPRKSKIPLKKKAIDVSGYFRRGVGTATEYLIGAGAECTENLIIIHIHGGGWVSQSPDQHLPYLSEWAKEAKLPAISIDYSLAPEQKYPVCVNECYAIYKWLQNPKNCQKMGLPVKEGFPMRAIVCGDSAGGNLSCAITVKALQEGILPPVGLLLHYPAVNLTDSASLSRMIFCHDPILNLETMRCVLQCYLGEKEKDAGTDPLISPFFVDDDILSNFPPTVISVGDVDPLVDDATSLFKRLQDCGIPSILRVFGTLPHGFLNLPTQLPKARLAIKDAGKYMVWLKYQFITPNEF